MFKDLASIENETSSNSLTLITGIKDGNKSIVLDFNSAYEKYVFKTILYNYQVNYTYKYTYTYTYTYTEY